MHESSSGPSVARKISSFGSLELALLQRAVSCIAGRRSTARARRATACATSYRAERAKRSDRSTSSDADDEHGSSRTIHIPADASRREEGACKSFSLRRGSRAATCLKHEQVEQLEPEPDWRTERAGMCARAVLREVKVLPWRGESTAQKLRRASREGDGETDFRRGRTESEGTTGTAGRRKRGGRVGDQEREVMALGSAGAQGGGQ